MLTPHVLRHPLVLSILIVVVYVLGGWIWITSFSTSMLGSMVGLVLFFPFTLAFAVGYGGGELMGWIVLLGGLFLIWLLIYGVVSSWPRK